MKTETVDIVWEDKPEKVEIKRLTFGERRKIRKECRKTWFEGNIQKVELDEDKYVIMMIQDCTVKAPFNHKDENVINDSDGTVIQKIFDRIETLNMPDEKKK